MMKYIFRQTLRAQFKLIYSIFANKETHIKLLELWMEYGGTVCKTEHLSSFVLLWISQPLWHFSDFHY